MPWYVAQAAAYNWAMLPLSPESRPVTMSEYMMGSSETSADGADLGKMQITFEVINTKYGPPIHVPAPRANLLHIRFLRLMSPVLAQIRYRPTWEYKLVECENWLPGAIDLKIEFELPDADKPGNTLKLNATICVGNDNMEHFIERPDHFIDWVFEKTVEMEKHEAGEFFRFQGEKPFYPHDQEGRANLTRVVGRCI